MHTYIIASARRDGTSASLTNKNLVKQNKTKQKQKFLLCFVLCCIGEIQSGRMRWSDLVQKLKDKNKLRARRREPRNKARIDDKASDSSQKWRAAGAMTRKRGRPSELALPTSPSPSSSSSVSSPT